MATTAEAGATKIVVRDVVDWKAGEEIVIAATQWNHIETERRFIKKVYAD